MMNFGKSLVFKFRPQQLMTRGYRTYDCELYMSHLEGHMNEKTVKILSTRISKPGCGSSIKKYLGELNKKVKGNDGFNSAESFWVPMTQNSLVSYESRRMITISEWNSREAWIKWLNSDTRKIVNENHKDSIESEEHLTLVPIPPPPIFLL